MRDLSYKQGTEKPKQESSNISRTNINGKKLSKNNQIAIKKNYLILLNITALEQRYLEKIIEEVWVIEDIKVYYFEAITDLILQKFNVLVSEMQKYSNQYKSYTTK